MAHYREAFVGIDVAKPKNAIAVAEFGRDGEIRYFGEMEASDVSMRCSIQRQVKTYKILEHGNFA